MRALRISDRVTTTEEWPEPRAVVGTVEPRVIASTEPRVAFVVRPVACRDGGGARSVRLTTVDGTAILVARVAGRNFVVMVTSAVHHTSCVQSVLQYASYSLLLRNKLSNVYKFA
jgi:hypothetical protein